MADVSDQGSPERGEELSITGTEAKGDEQRYKDRQKEWSEQQEGRSAIIDRQNQSYQVHERGGE